MVRCLSCFLFLFSFLCLPLQSEVIKNEGNGFLELKQEQLLLHVKGTPYEMGYQHGKLLKEQIHRNIATYIDNPQHKSSTKVNGFLKNLCKILSFVPVSFIEEMKGVADGSGLPIEKIYLLNLFPEMFHCSGVTVKGSATEDQSLYHVRVLDYAIGKNLQSSAVLIIAEPSEGISFVNVSYAGFIGSVTGMNAKKIAIGEIGGLGYGHWDGVPMAFIMRMILENATSIDDAKNILSTTPRTCEYYYVVSDGKTDESFGAYATSSQVQFIKPGTNYAFFAPQNLPDNFTLNGDNDKFCMTSCQVESTPYQEILFQEDGKIIGLFHRQPEDCLLMTGYSHQERYPVLVARILENFGRINAESLMEIIKRPVSRESNLHNAIFHPATAEVWIAQAGQNDEPACDEPYFHYSLDELLGN